MNVGSIAALATGMAQQRVSQQIGIAVLKKAIDAQASGAVSLIAALPAAYNLPAHLGQNINTTA